MVKAGLSPRVRGNLPCALLDTRPSRSIPASAGEPSEQSYQGRIQKVYPRECGGTRHNQSGSALDGGLSPRVRGNRMKAEWPVKSRGSIPASAGEPKPKPTSESSERVYPRECGGTSSTT